MNGKKAKKLRAQAGYNPNERTHYKQTNVHEVVTKALATNTRGEEVEVQTGVTLAYTANAIGSRQLYNQLKKEARNG